MAVTVRCSAKVHDAAVSQESWWDDKHIQVRLDVPKPTTVGVSYCSCGWGGSTTHCTHLCCTARATWWQYTIVATHLLWQIYFNFNKNVESVSVCSRVIIRRLNFCLLLILVIKKILYWQLLENCSIHDVPFLADTNKSGDTNELPCPFTPLDPHS